MTRTTDLAPPRPNHKVDTPQRVIGIKVTVIARHLRQLFDDRVERMGVTRAKYMLIAAVARNPGVTQRSIATMLEVTDVTAGRLIDRVTADGLLERRENPQDRRAYCIYLTPAAEPLLDLVNGSVKAYERDIFAGFTETELATLDGLLERLSQNLGNARRTTPGRRGDSEPTLAK